MTRKVDPSAPQRTSAARHSACAYAPEAGSAQNVTIGTDASVTRRRPYRSATFTTPTARVRRGEQLRLGPEIVLEPRVKVQVVLGEVGEHGDAVAGACDPAERQRVAGDLHRGRRHPALGHHGEQRLQVRRLRRGERRPDELGADPDLHPADQAGAVPGGAQPRLAQVACRGLAARPRHADHRHPVRRVAVDPAGDVAEPVARAGHHEDGDAGAGGPVAAVGVGEDRDRARGHGLVAVGRPVGTGAWQRGVQVTGPHRPGVEGDAGQDAESVLYSFCPSHTEQLSEPGQRARRESDGTDHAQRVSNISAH